MRSLSIRKGQTPTTEERDTMTAETLSAKEVARELNTDARTFRKFMRATTPKSDQPGQGNRYKFDPDELPGLKHRFTEWSKPKVKDESPIVQEIAIEDEFEADLLLDDIENEDDEDVPDFSSTDDEDEDEEPSDDDLAAIEASEDVDFSDLEEL